MLDRSALFDPVDYFHWLGELMGVNRPEHCDYLLLLKELHSIKYEYVLPMDIHRASDGIDLRYLYCDATDRVYVETDDPCTVLEMLIALSIRCERDIMGAPGQDQPERWFWEMLGNIGLLRCTDDNFNAAIVRHTIKEWEIRHIEKNGYGGIFPLSNPRRDQRKIEVWDQMHDYLIEKYPICI